MKHALKIAAVIVGLGSLPVHADVTLSFELSGPDMEPQIKTFSLARFFVRIDDPAEPDSYLLYQTGRFFPLYRVNKSTSTFTLLTPEVKPTLHAGITPKVETTQNKTVAQNTQTAPTEEKIQADTATAEGADTKDSAHAHTAMPATPALSTAEKASDTTEKPAEIKNHTTLRLTKKKQQVAGIKCRVIEELAGDKPIMTHCMADKVSLGISERELRSLARLFKMARERNLGWLGTTTPDEKFISITSQDLRSNKTLHLKAVSTKPLAAGYLRIPRDYKQVPLE